MLHTDCMHYSTEWLPDENHLENYCFANGNCCFNHCPDNCPHYNQFLEPTTSEELTFTIIFNDDTTLDTKATRCPTIQELNEYYDLHPDYYPEDQIQSIWLGNTRVYPIPFNL